MSSIFFAGVRADGASVCTEQASAPSRRRKSIHGAASSSERSGAFQYVMMFDDLPENGFEIAPGLTVPSSSAVLRRAKNIARQITAEEDSTPTIYSLRRSESSVSLDLIGQRLRTHLTCELEAMTELPMKWKQSASPAGRSWWVLQMPRHPIGVHGSGSYALTPTETGNLACDSMDKWKGGWGHFIPTARTNKGVLPDSHGKLLGFVPTPAAQTGPKKGGAELGGGGSGARKAVEAFLPTVTAQDYGSNMGGAAGRTGKKRPSLSSLARSLGLSGRQLLAAIYENMMGFPVGWLSSAALLTETQWDQSSRSSSDGQSSP